jgi:hypothetical protein
MSLGIQTKGKFVIRKLPVTVCIDQWKHSRRWPCKFVNDLHFSAKWRGWYHHDIRHPLILSNFVIKKLKELAKPKYKKLVWYTVKCCDYQWYMYVYYILYKTTLVNIIIKIVHSFNYITCFNAATNLKNCAIN